MIYFLIGAELLLGVGCTISICRKKEKYGKHMGIFLSVVIPFIILPVLSIIGLVIDNAHLMMLVVTVPFGLVYPILLVAYISGKKQAVCVGYDYMPGKEDPNVIECAVPIYNVNINGEAVQFKFPPEKVADCAVKHPLGQVQYLHSPIGNPRALSTNQGIKKLLTFGLIVTIIDVIVAIAIHSSIAHAHIS